MWWTVQVKTAQGWRTDWIEARSRAWAVVGFFEMNADLDRVEAIRTLVRPAVYKEWVADPPCGCPVHAVTKSL